ncbi:hypothetical protein AX769_20915 (plasmid) [Frondihabitans sp. PAMC 28766]|nr:hypothetical protein AX769_20915 [Frondihabitans sp. PAMC 28766]
MIEHHVMADEETFHTSELDLLNGQDNHIKIRVHIDGFEIEPARGVPVVKVSNKANILGGAVLERFD